MGRHRSLYTNLYALVIGVDAYRDDRFKPLGEAENDARLMSEALAAYGFQVAPPLLAEEATRENISAALAKLVTCTGSDDLIMIYYSGHGEPFDQTACIVPHNADGDDPLSVIALDHLILSCRRPNNARHVGFIFDSCFSALIMGVIEKQKSSHPVDKLLELRTYMALSAAAGLADDVESMTRFVLAELEKGSLDETTGLFTFSDLGHRVRAQMVAELGKKQIPQFGHLPRSEGGDIILAADLGPRLPPDLLRNLHSDVVYPRRAAVDWLIELTENDPILEPLAIEELARLRDNDPDEHVRGAAQEFFDEKERREQEEIRRRKAVEQARREAEQARRKQEVAEQALREVQEETARQREAAEQARIEAEEAQKRWEKAEQSLQEAEGDAGHPLPEAGDPQTPPPPEPTAAPTPPAVQVAEVATSPKRRLPAWAWIGGATVGVGALFVGVLALEGMFGGTAPTPEPFLPALTASNCSAVGLPEVACTGVVRNADWEPVIQDFEGTQMALVPAGCFMMGSENGDEDEQPVHEVCFEEPFWTDVYEVTNAQYGWAMPRCIEWSSDDDQPHVCVHWHAATALCESRGARLPTEAEWEYAARGPDALIYPWGNEFDCSMGNFDDEMQINSDVVEGGEGCDGYDHTAPVGSFADGASWVGIFDMSGNVWEWMADWYDEGYYGILPDPAINPQGPSNGDYRVRQGGSCANHSVFYLRVANRGMSVPVSTYIDLGFRCARDFDPADLTP